MGQESESRGRVRIEPGQKRVRAYLDGLLVADTVRPYLVWENPYFPAYYIPIEDVRAELVPTGEKDRSPSRGDAEIFDVVVRTPTRPPATTLPRQPQPQPRKAPPAATPTRLSRGYEA